MRLPRDVSVHVSSQRCDEAMKSSASVDPIRVQLPNATANIAN